MRQLPRPLHVYVICAVFVALTSSNRVPKSPPRTVQLSEELLKMLNEHFNTFGRPRFGKRSPPVAELGLGIQTESQYSPEDTAPFEGNRDVESLSESSEAYQPFQTPSRLASRLSASRLGIRHKPIVGNLRFDLD